MDTCAYITPVPSQCTPQVTWPGWPEIRDHRSSGDQAARPVLLIVNTVQCNSADKEAVSNFHQILGLTVPVATVKNFRISHHVFLLLLQVRNNCFCC